MVFYAGKIVQHPAMENPTIVVLTDRNDLDDQLFDTFSFCKELLRQTPVSGGEPGTFARVAQRRQRRRGVHHDSEILSR